ncbi:small ubiquitin-related modifier 2-like [Mercurialis annua]|uniref:small ubiquitin-related modifier 2-like n=1 Tax=Mercurialis annua TaxID=3986 RepID=UPI00215E0503|nr:small ubiquitin-related modifier 2-like [Mercurialis annua]
MDSSEIILKVRNQEGRVKNFRIRQDMKISKLIDNYCKNHQLEPGAVDFLYNGERFKRDKTPAELNMKDGTSIDAMIHQFGGGCRAF